MTSEDRGDRGGTGPGAEEKTTRSRFIGSPVKVEYSQEPGYKRPLTLSWNGQEAAVSEVISRWDDWGFGAAPPKRRHWWQRRHRTYYRVKTVDGRTFELYYDRSRREWFLTRELLGS